MTPDTAPAPGVPPPGRWRARLALPRTLAGRLTLLVVGGLIVIVFVSVGVGWHDRTQARRAGVAIEIAERAAEITRLVETTPAESLPLALAAIESPFLRVTVSPGRAGRELPGGAPEDAMAQAAAEALRARLGREVAVAVLGPPPGAEARGRHHPYLDHVERLVMRIPLADGRVLRLAAPLPGPLRSGPSFALWIGAAAALALLLTVFAVHRLTRPLAQFTVALDRFGTDLNAPPLAEHGSTEVRRAAAAFNRMQDRLRRFVTDRTRMLAAISHDLRTPLTRLRLRLEAIPDAGERAKAQADIAAMQQMIDASVAFARDALADEPPTALDLAALLQTLVDEAADAGRPARYQGPDRCPIVGRPMALRRAFANLLENAIRYGADAAVGLVPDAGAVEVTIDDHGPGIPAEMCARVFEPFVRLDGARGTETGGTGLGLAIVRSAVQAHGGEVAILDAPGGGCRVRVRLPQGDGTQRPI